MMGLKEKGAFLALGGNWENLDLCGDFELILIQKWKFFFDFEKKSEKF